MSEKEIKDSISSCISEFYCNDLEFDLLKICERLNERISDLEKRLDKAEGTARHAANSASCLANGIQPD